MTRKYRFIYSNITSNKLYFACLESNVVNNKTSYTYLSSSVVTTNNYVKQKGLVSTNYRSNFTTLTNIKSPSNLYSYLKTKFNPLRNFDIRGVNLEHSLFDIQDLIIGNDLQFISLYQERKINSCISKLDENFTNIGTGDSNILLSLVYLMASIKQSSSIPALPSRSFSTYL